MTCAVQRALAQIGDGIGMADGGAAIPATGAVISGFDPRLGDAPFCNEVVLLGGSGPGSPHTDGWLTMLTMGNAGMPLVDSIEVDEIHHPMLITERRMVPDSEGAGRFRGGPGFRVEYGPVDCDMELGYVCDGSLNPAKGARGGGDGCRARHFKRVEGNGDLVEVPDASAQYVLKRGEWVISYTPGGGGYGPPLERDPERVREDVSEGWITRERAREAYGVIFDASGSVDAEATAARRTEMAG